MRARPLLLDVGARARWIAGRWLLLIGFGVLTPGAAAQEVRGVIVEASTGASIEGALVEVLDPDGLRAGAAISNRRGGFAIWLRAAGSYRTRVRRIGYEAWMSREFTVPAGGLTIRLEIPVKPVPLPELRVEAQGRCGGTPAERRAARALYRRVLDALEPLVWTESQDLFVFQLVIEEEGPAKAPGGQPITVELIESLPVAERPARDPRRPDDPHAYTLLPAPPETVLVRQPIETLEPEYLVRLGFVQPWAAGGLRYFAPTPSTFVSEAFRRTHCFSVLETGEAAGVGLAFEPMPGTETTNVSGRWEVPALVRWFRERTSRIRSMENASISFGTPAMRGEFGGVLRFERLPEGLWITRSWELRIPVLWHTATWIRGDSPRIEGQPIALERIRRGRVVAVLAPERDPGR